MQRTTGVRGEMQEGSAVQKKEGGKSGQKE